MKHLSWFGEIVISAHALARYRERIGGEPDEELIRGEIRLAIISGRVSHRHPNWTRGIGWPGPHEPNVHYVWDEDATHAWAIAPPAQYGPMIVKSVLCERGRDVERAMARLLRPGMARA